MKNKFKAIVIGNKSKFVEIERIDITRAVDDFRRSLQDDSLTDLQTQYDMPESMDKCDSM